jgi:elongator complex protein 3
MLKAYDNFIKLAINSPRRTKTTEEFLTLKKELCGQLKLPLPTNADLRETYEKLVKQGTVKKSEEFERALLSRKVRTQSGVAIIAVLTKAYPCPGHCLYCPTEKDMPKSYLSNEPAVMRAIASKFDPYSQVWNRLRSLELNGHKTDKIELIVMGGTFSFLPKQYQKEFIYKCFKACNEYPGKYKVRNAKLKVDKLLEAEQKRNEKAQHRIVGLTLETRPDYINAKEVLNFRKLGCTRVELGVQSIFDDVLKINKRGHDVAQTIRATKLLKDAGFKINYHIMPGLPGSNLKKDYRMFQQIFSNRDFRPDMLKIYPTVVLKNSALYNFWKNGKYKPLTNSQFEKLVLRVKNELIPPYVRIQRLVRDVPATSIVAGPTISNLRQMIAPRSKCNCIRCREVGADYNIKDELILDRINYTASGGKEIFLQYVSPNKKKLFALLRLRIPGNKKSAIIREVHTYGKMTEINKKDKESPQHIGLGKKLMQAAERIAKKEFGLEKIVVISGVGVRGYYRKLGYKLEDTYMVKKL